MENISNIDNHGKMPKIVYILYLVGLLLGVTGIVGVVIAYVNKNDGPSWVQDHYRYQIRTFWMGAAYILTGALLSLIIIGWFIILFWYVWLIVRSVKGIKSLSQGKSPDKLESWLF